MATRSFDIITRAVRRRALKWVRLCCCCCCCRRFGVELSHLRSTVLITSLFCTRKMADACLVCLYKQETSSRGITFTCVPFFCELKLWWNVCFYRVDSSGKETGKDMYRQCDRCHALPEPLNASASIDLKRAKLFVAPALQM